MSRTPERPIITAISMNYIKITFVIGLRGVLDIAGFLTALVSQIWRNEANSENDNFE
jgi:hypothetical protein